MYYVDVFGTVYTFYYMYMLELFQYVMQMSIGVPVDDVYPSLTSVTEPRSVWTAATREMFAVRILS